MFFHHPATKQQPGAKVSSQPTAGGPAAQGDQSSLPTDQQAQTDAVNKPNTTADDIMHTRGADQTGQPLGSIQNFNSQRQEAGSQWSPPGYLDSTQNHEKGHNNKAVDIRLAQVTKPSLTFVLTSTDVKEPAHLASETPELLVTNLGYEPGFHIATHLESVVTTATKAPAIAVVDFDYRRNGIVVIPAGSRVIGEIEQATSTGVVGLHFTSIHLPDGEDIAINAVGLDQRMGPLKGAVTGRNRGKQFGLAALSGLGSTAAMFVGNNANGALSEADLIRAQAAQNVGQAADSQIQQLGVTEHLIITVPAGTQVQVTFVSPAKKKPDA
jgi:type IV secretory pathway VirB10-like protein